jgi:diguanylate cyclase (GGDEF)-like protein/PAS domain S-box-containing protein
LDDGLRHISSIEGRRARRTGGSGAMNGLHPELARQIGGTAGDLAMLLGVVSAAYARAEATNRTLARAERERLGLTEQLAGALATLDLTLETIRHGVMIIGPQGAVEACNPLALELLGFTGKPPKKGFNLSKLLPQLAKLDILRGDAGSSVELAMPQQRTIAVHARKIAGGGAALAIEDVSFDRKRQRAQKSAEAGYRSLFENAVCGIYRDQLDGTPVRCNPALAILNGYANEAQYISAVTSAHGAWYVEPGRSDEFNRLMRTEGGVKDFVSEVYRHRTRERFWITENAWYVRDTEGNPLFIEGTIQDATERMTSMAIIERQANLDALTGIASRFRFLGAIEDETRPGTAGCTLYSIDLDRFKEVNDLLGHATGDIVLKDAAMRLSALVGKAGLVARLGGDEFAILMPGLVDPDEAEALAARIVSAMRVPMEVNGHNLLLGSSVGVAIYPAQAADAQELLSNSDLAMYQAKSAGRNGYRVFDFELRAGIQHRKDIEAELRLAIGAGELELHYQPIVEGGRGMAHGYEALMRWNHPVRGFMVPSQFIPIAEEAGLMTELGNWAITRACAQAAALPSHISVAVNVSPNQFRSATILSALRQALEETGLDPKRLVLEVTESVILTSEFIAEKVLDGLQELGVSLALDDFGTGYSSLSYLQRLAFQKVKIDKSFVAEMIHAPASLAIVRAIVGLGRDLGIEVVAEGVETREQADALRREGCRFMQGYFYGRPKPYSEIVADLALERLSQHLPDDGANRRPPKLAVVP